jgi:hypothetical protein
MRQTLIVAATTALITAVVAIWGTTVIIAHTEHLDDANAPVDLVQMMQRARTVADANAAPVD